MNLRKLSAEAPIYYYGFEANDDYRAENLIRSTRGSSFDAYFRGEKLVILLFLPMENIMS